MRFIKFFSVAVLSLGIFSTCGHSENSEDHPLVFAASSLTAVLTEHAAQWSVSAGSSAPRLSFGASATMARQIGAGAPAHIFISANPVWAKKLSEANLTQDLAAIATNQLVLISPQNRKITQPFKPTMAYFSFLMGGGRLAIANPELAPLGAYTRRYLEKVALWEYLKNKAAYGQNARQTLRLAEQGGLPAFVYRSDAAMNQKVTSLYVVPAELTDPIIYQAALLKNASATSRAFYIYLKSEEAQTTWASFGFGEIQQIASK